MATVHRVVIGPNKPDIPYSKLARWVSYLAHWMVGRARCLTAQSRRGMPACAVSRHWRAAWVGGPMEDDQ
jgi:hypothetical protein